MDNSDWAVVSSLLEGEGPIGPDRDYWIKKQTKLDPDGRVVELMLGTSWDNPRWKNGPRNIKLFWSLDGALIVKLDKLKKLSISSCQSLPLEALAQLPHLECLELYSCYGMALADSVGRALTTSPPTVLSNLVRLKIHSGIWDDTSMRVWMKWVVTSLPILQDIRLVFLPKQRPHPEPRISAAEGLRNDRDDVINNVGKNGGHLVDAVTDELLLVGDKSSFRHSLKGLELFRCGMTNAGLQRLLHGMLPKYPNFSFLGVGSNKISSLQFLLPKDGDPCPSLSSTSLKSLHLEFNPILKKLAKSEPECRALIRLLDVCPLLGSLSILAETWDASIDGRLHVNRSGSRILFCQHESKVIDVIDGRENGIDPSNASKVIPDGLWPVLLERAYATSAKGFDPANRHNATGVYYLLRNHFFCNQ